jgi:hypothetical protein
MCMLCGVNSPRSATSKPYNPQSQPKPNYNHRQNMASSGNNTRSNDFGAPKVKFSGRTK